MTAFSSPPPSPREQDDGTLLTALRQGDTQAFEQLVERYNARLLRLIEHCVPDQALAEDVLQHVWLQFYSSQATLSSHGSMWFWLSRVARNRCIDERRRLRRTPLLFSHLHLPELEEEEGVLLELPDPAPTPEEQVERDEMQQTIEAAISALPSPVRAVVQLRLFGSLSYQEIGRQLHLPEATAKVRFHRAKQLLRNSPFLQDVWPRSGMSLRSERSLMTQRQRESQEEQPITARCAER